MTSELERSMAHSIMLRSALSNLTETAQVSQRCSPLPSLEALGSVVWWIRLFFGVSMLKRPARYSRTDLLPILRNPSQRTRAIESTPRTHRRGPFLFLPDFDPSRRKSSLASDSCTLKVTQFRICRVSSRSFSASGASSAFHDRRRRLSLHASVARTIAVLMGKLSACCPLSPEAHETVYDQFSALAEEPFRSTSRPNDVDCPDSHSRAIPLEPSLKLCGPCSLLFA